ncbi:MAG: beta-N-acetylhexosaminidase [Halobacteriovoraceae bacterium]|nr:beta-N-acetylhexosaminidase [Halobacteriovoraceae bacterium]
MNLFEVGQLFITGIEGITLKDEERKFILDNNIGGVILFKNNFSDPGQLAELINDIQTLRDEYPLFISVDQEGGRVRRFQTHFTQFPSMFEIGKKDSPKLTFEVHKVLADELSSCGINLDFSPCCDIWSNPKNNVIGDRAFSDKAEDVEKHVSAAIRGLHTGGVLACAKHFPGHGNTSKDSHFDLPFVKKTLEELRAEELVPFQKASKSRAEFMMMAHLVVDAIDKELPCTLSKKAYDFLREELKYKKIIITDDMEMKAVADRFTNEEAAIKALNAGADIIMYRSLEKTKSAYEAVMQAIKEQTLNKGELEAKIRRVMSCKQKFFKEYKPVYIPTVSKSLRVDRQSEILDKISQA